MTTRLCRLADIADPGGKGVTLELGGGGRREIVVIRRGDEIFAYVNACPHIGTTLETFPDQFLTRDRREILCTTHGARFRIVDGYCVAGPCLGLGLTPIAIRLRDGEIELVS